MTETPELLQEMRDPVLAFQDATLLPWRTVQADIDEPSERHVEGAARR